MCEGTKRTMKCLVRKIQKNPVSKEERRDLGGGL